MPLKLTFIDKGWGEVTDSVHVISGITNSNGKEKRCYLTIEVFKNVAFLLSGADPIFYASVACEGENFDAVTGALVTAQDVGTSLRAAQLKRAEQWLMTLPPSSTNGFDYSTAVII
jgi:hypothetical protein